MKNRKAIYIPNAKLIFRDLNYIRFFDNIKINNLSFIFTNKVNIPNNLNKKNYKVLNKPNSFRYLIWEISHYLNRLNYEKINFKKKPNQNLDLGVNKFFFCKLVFFFGLDKIVMYLFNKIFYFTQPKNYDHFKKFEEIIFFGSPKDYNFDDLMYICKKNKIKSKLIFTNWDNATTKPYYLKPDIVYCWGSETSKLSKKIHKINSKEIGSIRFEKHQEIKKKYNHLKKDQIKKKFNLDKNCKYLLFAGVTFPFDEKNSLELLNSVINKKYKNLKIIYKAHPYGRVIVDSTFIKKLKNIIVIPNNKFSEFKNYYFLLNSIEGIISPFSTMVLEGLYYNKPALCLAFNDNNKNVFDWNKNSLYQPHLQILRKYKNPIWCYEKNELEKKFIFFVNNLKKLNNNAISRKILKASVLISDKKYINRINEIIN